MPRTIYRKCQRCGNNRNRDRFVGQRGRICDACRSAAASSAARGRRLKEVYEVEPEEWDAVIASQGGVCAGCGQPRSYRLNVDHDHKIEKELGMRASLRGGLCRRCNKVLRDIRDSIPVLRGLIDYLLEPPARKVLDASSSLRES